MCTVNLKKPFFFLFLFYIRSERTNIVPVLLNRVQLALAVTFLCQLIKVEMCNQTLASLSAAETNTHILHLQRNGQWRASSHHTQTINSIHYYFHLYLVNRKVAS